jgi:allophanate hydrolase subunit 2
VLPGPRAGWLDGPLAGSSYAVSARSNRVGVRLDGPALRRARHDEVAPEGLLDGAVQLPPDGKPVVFLADHPVTGGYPVVAVLIEADVALLAQCRPGTRVVFAAAARP